MPSERIPITRPVFNHAEETALVEVLRSGWVVQGPRVAEFEDKFRKFTGAKHAIATTSCTTALHLALLAAGIGPGDEVLIPSFTFVATANAVEYTGAKPVCVDIDLDTFTIDPELVKAYLDGRTEDASVKPKCIVPVSLFGLCADMKAINEIAADYGLLVVEDAACGFGARREGRHAGTEALAGCFSFHPRKAITTGEGGMVITDDDGLAETVCRLRDHGASKTDLERHLKAGGSLLPEFNVLGFNYRMTDFQGALGATQMSKAETILKGRREAALRYNRLLHALDKIKAPFVPKGYAHAYQSYVCLYGADTAKLKEACDIDWPEIESLNRQRNQLMAQLEGNGIAVRQGTHAVHTLGYYKKKYGFNDYDYPMSYVADRLSITLPLYGDIPEQEQSRVVDGLWSFLDKQESRPF